MKRIHFDLETDGFYGAYLQSREPSGCAVIALAGDAPEDYLAKACAKWFLGKGVNVLSMSTAKKDCGYHNYPLERIEAAICRLQSMGNRKTGIAGVSTTGTMALSAASYFQDITLTIALTPTDFIWQGVMQGRRDGCKEWPAEGESLLSYRGEPLPYMPFVCQHPQYWRSVAAESRRTGDMIYARKLYEDSEAAHSITEAEIIKVEDIHGKLLLIGAEDDVLWNTAKYIRGMEKRLAEKPHDCEVEAVVYEHGPHFVFPEGMMRLLLPIGSALAVGLAFKAAGAYPKECRATRMDIDRRITRTIAEWRKECV